MMKTRHRKHFIILLAAFAALFVLSGCLRYVRIDEKDVGSIVPLHPGDILEVRLWANRTAGYQWTMTHYPSESVLQQLGDSEYKPDKQMQEGSGGTYIYRFRAAASGTTTLELTYWKGCICSAHDTFSVVVFVR